MRPVARRLLDVCLSVLILGAVPGIVAAASPDPSVVVDTPWLRAVGSFLLVLPFGGFVLLRYGSLLDRSVDASMSSPFVSTVYGVIAHLAIIFAAGVFSTQLANAGVGQEALTIGSTAVLGAVLLGLAGFGFAVVGTWLTGLRGERRPWQGLVVAAAVGAVGWLVPVLLVGVVMWVLVVSVGIGGLTRRWVHSERTVDSEAEV